MRLVESEQQSAAAAERTSEPQALRPLNGLPERRDDAIARKRWVELAAVRTSELEQIVRRAVARRTKSVDALWREAEPEHAGALAHAAAVAGELFDEVARLRASRTRAAQRR